MRPVKTIRLTCIRNCIYTYILIRYDLQIDQAFRNLAGEAKYAILNSMYRLSNPFSFLSIFNLSSFKELNWFEGLKRVKIFLQWLWGVPSVLIVLFISSPFSGAFGSFSALTLFWDLVILSPILGFELLFRAVVWIVGGFLQDVDSKSFSLKIVQGYSAKESK